MNAPWILTHRFSPQSGATSGWFLPLGLPLERIALHIAPRHQPGRWFALAHGFLGVRENADWDHGMAGIRLQCRHDRIWFPQNADLLPAVWPDEVPGLLGEWGVVFLPGCAPQTYDPRAPMALEDLVRLQPLRKRTWRPFPQPPSLAKSLVRIERIDPAGERADPLSQGAPEGSHPLVSRGDGQISVPEEARPPRVSPTTTLTSLLGLNAGRLLHWLGQRTGSESLKNQGKNLAQNALRKAPRITEQLLGKQEAALRELLRQFRSGEAEKALRRAPRVAGGDGEDGGTLSGSAHLPERDPRYDLRSLWGGRTQGQATWLVEGNVWQDLAAEYRKLADEALKNGDHRRAAYLYGHLLGDLHGAAQALSKGGLWRDAAILYRDRLNQPEEAARHFHWSGDLDEAIRLYDQLEKFEQAGDLATEAGWREIATVRYAKACANLEQQGRFLAAGDLALRKLQDLPMAMNHYQRGWDAGSSDALQCGLNLLERHASEDDWDRFLEMFDHDNLTGPGANASFLGRFCNAGRRLAISKFSPVQQEEWEDRIRMLGARHLERQARHSETRGRQFASELFPLGQAWPDSVQADALRATVWAARIGPGSHPRTGPQIPQSLVQTTIHQATMAIGSGDLLLLTDQGLLVWRTDSGSLETVISQILEHEVLGLVCDPDAQSVAILTEEPVEPGSLGADACPIETPFGTLGRFLRGFHHQPRVGFSPARRIPISRPGQMWLQPQPFRLESGDWALGIAIDSRLITVSMSRWTNQTEIEVNCPDPPWFATSDFADQMWLWDRKKVVFRYKDGTSRTFFPSWESYWEEAGWLDEQKWSWLFPDVGEMSLLWVDTQGRVHGHHLNHRHGGKAVKHWILPGDNRFVDVCHLGLDRFATLTTRGTVEWWKIVRGKPLPHGQAFAPGDDAIHWIFARIPMEECLGLTHQGKVYRIPFPS